MIPDQINAQIISHYAREPLVERILAALTAAGKSADNLQIDDLAPIDEFHSRGRRATVELARAAQLGPAMQILDVGCGIGGAARCLAATIGCGVIGVDLSDEYCRVATLLTELTGLSHLVSYQQGDALDLPFVDQHFDSIWTQHAAMNIADKKRLYGEFYRVLKPGGVLAMYDVVAGSGAPLHYPVPWATVQETSFLLLPEELEAILTETGFSIRSWQDDTATALDWFGKVLTRTAEAGLPPLGLQLLLGEDFQVMLRNQFRNLQKNRIRIVQVIAVRS
jgi:ubiquinone/menaquinone biosynthesis C-methylase UbiE